MREVAYFDYAASAGPRPPEVVDAVAAYLRDCGAVPGRGTHRWAIEVGRLVLRVRQRLAELLRAPGDPGRITFHANATAALNVALRSLVRPGDRVVRTDLDHNAVRRPLERWARHRRLEVRRLPVARDGSVDLTAAERLLAGARLLVLPHVSNVLGVALPVRALAERARAAGAFVLLDAAQSVGHIDVDVTALGVDAVAFSGHKGLLGPPGVGVLWLREGVPARPLVRGGTGADSWRVAMPACLPDRLEAGTLNAAGLVGLDAALSWHAQHAPATRARVHALAVQLFNALEALPGVHVLSPPPSVHGAPIVTIALPGRSSESVARALDREFGVLVRAGLHCAPETHALLGTLRTGAVRFSLGWRTTPLEVTRAVAAVAAIAMRGNEGGEEDA